MRTLEDVGPAKLLPPEQATLRFAADQLLFCADIVHDGAARRAYADVERLCDHLVRAGRWNMGRADRLGDQVWDCGPGLPTRFAVAA
jgi:hypothetical protein